MGNKKIIRKRPSKFIFGLLDSGAHKKRFTKKGAMLVGKPVRDAYK